MWQKGSAAGSVCKDKTHATIISCSYSINTGILDQEANKRG